MSKQNKAPREEASNNRKDELIEATLRLIATDGIKAATVRSISEQAKVTQGLIRYHFKSKDDLIIAAYEKHMTNLIDLAAQAAEGEFDCAKKRLARFVQASVLPPIVDSQAIALWAGFFQMLFHNPAMRESHRKTYNLLRLHLKKLIEDVLVEEARSFDEPELRRLSIACNAVLDGLWIEGGALPEELSSQELVDVAVTTFGQVIGVELMSHIQSELQPPF
ncbi:TetR/AcrR family transcriptional regulator [Vibrio ziniensis]|uniref:TetR family transcriptional regulator n=1 Tax=Vibrio ziniensis TaxID=2711221 RepID=A0A6G7CEJ7_9VIBR|nr:TetR family transcriptional regulator C-terminal domain-containing protein [Vibrio ziniensis]QIH40527.1 TetR family transcriptional regulator [Vibrio ziniensis]